MPALSSRTKKTPYQATESTVQFASCIGRGIPNIVSGAIDARNIMIITAASSVSVLEKEI
jgi:hypothetical protein